MTFGYSCILMREVEHPTSYSYLPIAIIHIYQIKCILDKNENLIAA